MPLSRLNIQVKYVKRLKEHRIFISCSACFIVFRDLKDGKMDFILQVFPWKPCVKSVNSFLSPAMPVVAPSLNPEKCEYRVSKAETRSLKLLSLFLVCFHC